MSAMLLCLLCLSLAAPPALAAAAPPPPLPPPPPPPPPGPPAVPVLAPPGACESLGPCELFAELQEHSRRIAGFSYNVKKADAALTTLARQQAAAADRAQRLADTIRQLETGLEAAANGEGGNSTDGAGGGGGGGGGTGLLMVAAPVAATAAPDWEKAASREMARLGDRLSRLREQVNTSFVPTLRENGEELGVLRGRVASLHVQVADLEAAVRGETVGRRVSAAGGDDDGPSQSPRGTSAAPPTSTPTAPPATPDSSSSESQEVEIQTETAVGVAEAATEAVAEGTTVGWEGMADLEEGGERGGGNVTEEATSTTASIAAPSSTTDAEEEVFGSTAVTEAPTALVVQTDGEGSGSLNGNGNGNGNGESVDLLGIELETVRGAFETLHAQVTELQTRCVTRGDELEALVTSLEERLAKLEVSRLPSSETASQSAVENSTEATLIGNESSSSPAPDLQFPVEPITLQMSPTQLFTFGSEHHQDELPTVETTNVSDSTTQASEPATSETGVQ
ncbi:hypothetical protein R5R35_011243 [Gryllus longicercus]|uniref:Accessory gland protein n=1 Tax=Gryllus longicercus TaxID=2509291 RepID=A0AAN9ZBJ2_9ORTH